MLRAAHGSETVGIKTAESKLLLDALEHELPQVFVELKYPIVKGRDPFRIKLLNELVQPVCRKIYPLSELELQELQSQIKTLIDSDRIVPLSSPYGSPVLFAAKKGAGL